MEKLNYIHSEVTVLAFKKLAIKWLPLKCFKSQVKMLGLERGRVFRQQEIKSESELKRDLEFLRSSDCFKPGILDRQLKEVKQKLENIEQNINATTVVRSRAQRW